MATSSRTHNCYKNFELKDDKLLFKCDGCKMNGVGERYVCKLCDETLHKGCRYPKPTLSHELLKFSTFKFVNTPSITIGKDRRKSYKGCIVCSKDICGFSYHCQAKKIDLHISCSKLPTKIRVGHFIFNLNTEKLTSKCDLCEDNTTVTGWHYVSSYNTKCHFHAYCFMVRTEEVNMKQIDIGWEKIQSNKKYQITGSTSNTKLEAKKGGFLSKMNREMHSLIDGGKSNSDLTSAQSSEVLGKLKMFFSILFTKLKGSVIFSHQNVMEAAKKFSKSIYGKVLKGVLVLCTRIAITLFLPYNTALLL